jgi:hypothetical protein
MIKKYIPSAFLELSRYLGETIFSNSCPMFGTFEFSLADPQVLELGTPTVLPT